MTAIPMLDEEECLRCHQRPRLAGSRSTWCRECKNAWQRDYRAGVRRQVRVPEPVRDANGCLLWQGHIMPNGYGARRVDGVRVYAHRYAYEQAHGPIPGEMVIDHLCRVRACVELSHLEPVTIAENLRRGIGNKPQDFCKQGHPMDRVSKSGRRYCGECVRRRNAARRAAA